MTHRVNFIVAFAVALFLARCAGMHVAVEGDNAKGVRYYQRAPFLLVYTDNAGGLTSKLLFLPDTRKVMSAYPYSILATNKSALAFTEGVLTSGEVDADSTVIPKAVLAALEKIATTSLTSASNEPETKETKTVPGPVLYRIDFKNGTAILTGAGTEYAIKFGAAAVDGAK